jgi:hypothetical protein
MAARRTNKTRLTSKPLKFYQRLVLNQWMLTLFGVNYLEELSEDLKGRRVVGVQSGTGPGPRRSRFEQADDDKWEFHRTDPPVPASATQLATQPER